MAGNQYGGEEDLRENEKELLTALASTRVYHLGEISAAKNVPWRSAASVSPRHKAAARASHAWTRRRSQGTTFAPSQQTATSSGEHHGLAVDSRARETVERPGERAADQPRIQHTLGGGGGGGGHRV